MKHYVGLFAAAGAMSSYIRHASNAEAALASLPGEDLRQRAIEIARTTTMDTVEAVAYVARYGFRRLPGERPTD